MPTGGPLSRSRLQWVRSWYGRASYDWALSPPYLNHLQLGFNRQRNPSLSTHLDENGVAALGLTGPDKRVQLSGDQLWRQQLPGELPNARLSGQ